MIIGTIYHAEFSRCKGEECSRNFETALLIVLIIENNNNNVKSSMSIVAKSVCTWSMYSNNAPKSEGHVGYGVFTLFSAIRIHINKIRTLLQAHFHF